MLPKNSVHPFLGAYQAVSKWECDANTPDISLLLQIATYFNTSIDALFYGEGGAPTVTPDGIADDDVIRVVQMRGKEVIAFAEGDRPLSLVLAEKHEGIRIEVCGDLKSGLLAATVFPFVLVIVLLILNQKKIKQERS